MMHFSIQFIDNHLIVPKIVGSKVKLNALICLIAIFSGGALWGVPGMFLAIPLTAIIKMIFDHVDSLKSWGFLMGESVRPSGRSKFSIAINHFFKLIISKFHKQKKVLSKN
jgi:predicted PurR-regulated permease PerM